MNSSRGSSQIRDRRSCQTPRTARSRRVPVQFEALLASAATESPRDRLFVRPTPTRRRALQILRSPVRSVIDPNAKTTAIRTHETSLRSSVSLSAPGTVGSSLDGYWKARLAAACVPRAETTNSRPPLAIDRVDESIPPLYYPAPRVIRFSPSVPLGRWPLSRVPVSAPLPPAPLFRHTGWIGKIGDVSL